jgi:hypothetical protein
MGRQPCRKCFVAVVQGAHVALCRQLPVHYGELGPVQPLIQSAFVSLSSPVIYSTINLAMWDISHLLSQHEQQVQDRPHNTHPLQRPPFVSRVVLKSPAFIYHTRRRACKSPTCSQSASCGCSPTQWARRGPQAAPPRPPHLQHDTCRYFATTHGLPWDIIAIG